jgi:hypothetical protein
MTYIISTVTESGILMGSDTRLNIHDIETNPTTGEQFQIIKATADCMRKTFVIKEFGIGIQFIGIGYFNHNNEKYPLSYFIDSFTSELEVNDNLETKFSKIFNKITGLTQEKNTSQFVNGVMTGYEDNIPYMCTFNTFDKDFQISKCTIGCHVESGHHNNENPIDKDKSIEYIKNKIKEVSSKRPYDVGGTIEIIEVKSNGECSWVEESSSIFHGSLSELFKRFNNNPKEISGTIFPTPHRIKMDL